MDELHYPKLRNVDVRSIVRDGQPSLVLRDPLQLSDKLLIVPQPLGLVLSLCDGTREDAGALSASLAVRYGLRVAPGVIERLLAALNEALLLDNASFAQACERALAEYRQAPARPAALAGRSYPADVNELRQMLQGYLDAVDETAGSPSDLRGLVSPHIDYERGGPVYAAVWKRAAEAIRAAELVLLLGIDHFGEGNLLTLTRQPYATPFGVLPTAGDVVEALAEAIGQDKAFAGELCHRSEHSIELAAVWLHYVRGEPACQVVPLLCGSFGPFIRGEAEPEHDPAITGVLEAFQQATAGRRVLVAAAVDLSHAGPAFGGQPLDRLGRARLQVADDELLEHMRAGDARGFLTAVRRVQDRNNVCGVPAIYLALRLLSPLQGEQLVYTCCPADENGTSLVSVCGMVFS